CSAPSAITTPITMMPISFSSSRQPCTAVFGLWMSMSSPQTHTLARFRQRELLRRFVLAASVGERLAPFLMQPRPIRRVSRSFLEFRDREVRAVLRDQRLTPHLQRIGEVRAFLVGAFELPDRAVEIALAQQHFAPVGVGEGKGWRVMN